VTIIQPFSLIDPAKVICNYPRDQVYNQFNVVTVVPRIPLRHHNKHLNMYLFSTYCIMPTPTTESTDPLANVLVRTSFIRGTPLPKTLYALCSPGRGKQDISTYPSTVLAQYRHAQNEMAMHISSEDSKYNLTGHLPRSDTFNTQPRQSPGDFQHGWRK
jgi:hypothetical protein